MSGFGRVPAISALFPSPLAGEGGEMQMRHRADEGFGTPSLLWEGRYEKIATILKKVLESVTLLRLHFATLPNWALVWGAEP